MKLVNRGASIGVAAIILVACGGSSSDSTAQQDSAGNTDIESEDSTANTSGSTDTAGTGNTDTTTETGNSNTVGLQNCPALTASGSVAELVGLWDLSELDSDGAEDFFYLQIESNGQVTEYDYEQDAYGGGSNCYLIDSAGVVSRVSGSTYINTFYDDPDFDCQVDTDSFNGVVGSNGALNISYIDDDDEDGDDDRTETLTFIYPSLNGISVADLNACADE